MFPPAPAASAAASAVSSAASAAGSASGVSAGASAAGSVVAGYSVLPPHAVMDKAIMDTIAIAMNLFDLIV